MRAGAAKKKQKRSSSTAGESEQAAADEKLLPAPTRRGQSPSTASSSSSDGQAEAAAAASPMTPSPRMLKELPGYDPDEVFVVRRSFVDRELTQVKCTVEDQYPETQCVLVKNIQSGDTEYMPIESLLRKESLQPVVPREFEVGDTVDVFYEDGK